MILLMFCRYSNSTNLPFLPISSAIFSGKSREEMLEFKVIPSSLPSQYTISIYSFSCISDIDYTR